MNGRILDSDTAEGQIAAAIYTVFHRWVPPEKMSLLDYKEIEEIIRPAIDRAVLFAILKEDRLPKTPESRGAMEEKFDILTRVIEGNPFWQIVRGPRRDTR
jgi:hypothetical protein